MPPSDRRSSGSRVPCIGTSVSRCRPSGSAASRGRPATQHGVPAYVPSQSGCLATPSRPSGSSPVGRRNPPPAGTTTSLCSWTRSQWPCWAGGGPRGAGRDRELLQLGYHLACEQAHVPLRLGVVHAGVAEDPDERVVADATSDVEDLLVALLGRAPDLEVHEVLDHLVGPVLLDLLGHLPVILVALGLREVVVLEVVVVEDGLVVATDVAA